jgi:hypothetical protein
MFYRCFIYVYILVHVYLQTDPPQDFYQHVAYQHDELQIQMVATPVIISDNQ